MKRLIFKRKECVNPEWLVMNKRKDILGEICYWKIKGHKKKDFWFFVNWNPMDSDRDFWLGSDCLREIADFIDKAKEKGEKK